MKTRPLPRLVASTLALSLAAAAPVSAQTATTQGGANIAQQPKTLSAKMQVYVFPAANQTAQQQSADEGKCYAWAIETTGIDPQVVEQQTAAGMQQAQAQSAAGETARSGARVKGGIAGAATGALIGEIASNDAGEGAAIGAAAGIIAGGARRRSAKRQAEAQAEATATHVQQVSAEQMDAFRKAFAVCLEAKSYQVKL